MKVIITGGAGFIGCNAAKRHMSRGDHVVIVDDLSRRGADANLRWLKEQGGFTFERVDIRQAEPTRKVFEIHRDAGLVLHLAGQVAVTLSVRNPRDDFEANAIGTFNVLEGARQAEIRAPMIFASTNKVYGGMEDVGIVLRDGRYAYADMPNGTPEGRQLDFHSPYGCSKGAADQYWRDYQRIYGLRTVVFRQSCIYGYRQFGFEDQGWVAWFTIAALLGRPITIYGNGRQVRDILFIEDLLDAYDCAARRIDEAEARCYNIGGGPSNTISLLDLICYLEGRLGRKIPLQFRGARHGDQRVFVADIGRADAELGWQPRIGWGQGLDKLYEWVDGNKGLFA